MKRADLNPGDRVVELAALAVSAGVATGAIAGACVLGFIERSWLGAAGGFCAGAVAVLLIAQPLARSLYRTGDDTTVVKVGSESLRATIPAGLVGGVAAGVTVALLAVLSLGAVSLAVPVFGIAIACGAVLGIALACLATLT